MPNPELPSVNTRGFRAAKTSHFNGKTFFQPGSHPVRLFRDFLRWRFTSRPTPWPKAVALVPQPPPPTPQGDQIVATWLGHATFLIQSTRGNILFDPVFSERVSPFRWIGPRRVHPMPMALAALPRIDGVCVSHDHYDHFDAATLRTLARMWDCTFIAPLRHRDLLGSVGAKRIVELDWWESHRLEVPGVAPDLQLEIVLTPTKHWTNRLGTPRNHRLWGGFWMQLRISDLELRKRRALARSPSEVSTGNTQPSEPAGILGSSIAAIRNPARRLWFVGDSGYDQSLLSDIRQRLGPPDVALVPIGAYEPRWFMAPMHMSPDEAVRLHRDVDAKLSLAMHWGTFQLTDEGRDDPVQALARARIAHGLSPETFRVLEPGESVVV